MGAIDRAPVTEIQVKSHWEAMTVTGSFVRVNCVESGICLRFHAVDQFNGSWGSLEGRGISVFFALPSSFMISVPGISSTLSYCAILKAKVDVPQRS